MTRRTGLRLDPRQREPIYRQIFDQIAQRIRSGAFPGGFRLPPTRTLARELVTNRNTVVRAYEDLENAGFVTSVVGRGTFVSAELPAAPAASPAETRLPWASLVSNALRAEPLARHDRTFRGLLRGDLINLASLQPSYDLLPDELLRRCIDHVLRTVGPRALRYGPREGLPRLRELIADDLARQGVPARMDDVLITTGSQQAIDLVARALVNPGETVLTDTLTYSGAITVFAAAGARVVGVPSDDEGPSVAALSRLTRAGAKALYVIPNCHNPTGTSISQRRREQLVAWSHDAGVPIVEDDYGADLNLDGLPMPPALRALDADVVYLGTFSKKLIPALRIGFVVCPPALGSMLPAMKHVMDCGTSLLMQHALAEFLERGYMRAHLARILPEYKKRRDALHAGLTAHAPSSISWRLPDKGELVWVPLPASLHPEAVTEEARRRGVVVGPSTMYVVDRDDDCGVRLTFCAESAERISEGGRRVGKALAALLSQSRHRPSFAPAPSVEAI